MDPQETSQGRPHIIFHHSILSEIMLCYFLNRHANFLLLVLMLFLNPKS